MSFIKRGRNEIEAYWTIIIIKIAKAIFLSLTVVVVSQMSLNEHNKNNKHKIIFQSVQFAIFAICPGIA